MNTHQEITIEAHGAPKGQPRPRAFSRGGHAHVFDPATAEGWKGQIALAARPLIPPAPVTTPVKVSIFFRFARPKNHFGMHKGIPYLRADAPDLHTSKPDLDNLEKAVLDTLTELHFWTDDALVSDLSSCKRYAIAPAGPNSEGATIRISF
jgi:Holliday junction resolvase RusA-like endonuclease